MSRYPNWKLLQNTTKHKFFVTLILIFLFSSAKAEYTQSDNTYQTDFLVKTNPGFQIESLRKFKDGLLYSSQNELFFNLDKINFNTFNSDDFRINNIIIDQDDGNNDFYVLTSTGVYKNFHNIFSKEECFHLEKHKSKIWVSCKSGIYLADKNLNWELDAKSPQGVVFFTLNSTKNKPKYAASSQLGFYKLEKGKWLRSTLGLRRAPDGDFHFGRFLVTETFGVETIFLPTRYGVAISNNQAKDFFVDDDGIKKENGQIEIKEINLDQSKNQLLLIANTGFYKADLELIPKWKQVKIDKLRKSENNFVNYTAIELEQSKIYLATKQGEIILYQDNIQDQFDKQISNKRNFGANYFSSKELIENFLNLEPQIAKLHKKALEFAGIPTGEHYQSYSKRAKLRNLAPRLETYLERDNQDLLLIESSGEDDIDQGRFSTNFSELSQNRNNSSINTGVRLAWDFTKLIYDEEQNDINNNARLTANIRENLLTEVTQLYFQRKENISEAIKWIISQEEIHSDSELLKRKLKLEETLAQLDARTGAWYSSQLNKNLSHFNFSDPQSHKAMELYTNVKIN